MAYSFYSYAVPEKLTIDEAASAPESLSIILFGVMAVLPLTPPTWCLAARLSAASRRVCATIEPPALRLISYPVPQHPT
jgi:hypothetical protein